jgi:hypothetical protein
MQVTLTEVNIKRMVQLLRTSASNHDQLLADYLEGFLKTQPTFNELDLDEIPF